MRLAYIGRDEIYLEVPPYSDRPMPEHTHDLSVEVQEAIAAFRSGPGVGEGRLTWYARCAEELAEAVHALAVNYEGDRSELKAKATVLALQVFDEFVVPYDVPNVGVLVESWLESTVRGVIPSLVAAAFDQLPKNA